MILFTLATGLFFSGALLLYASISFLFQRILFIKSAVTVEGTILRVESKQSRAKGNGVRFTPIFQYVFNGKTYENATIDKDTLIFYSKGDKEILLINPSAPEQISENRVFRFLPFIILLLGAIVFGGYGVYILQPELHSKYYQYILQGKGKMIHARNEGREGKRIRVMEFSFSRMVATWTNPQNLREYRFLSRFINESDMPNTVEVWIDPKDPSRYWLDDKID